MSDEKNSKPDEKVSKSDETSKPEKNSTPDEKSSTPEKVSKPDEKVSKPDETSKPEKVETYTITIAGGSRDRVIKLSSKMFRLGIASVIFGGALLLITSAWAFYSSLRMQRDAATIREIEHAAELRQEQLLTLSKKAATLSETIQNLTRQEQELRIQAGLNPIKDETPPTESPAEQPPAENASTENPTTETSSTDENPQPEENSDADEHNGQGGPVGELEISEVSEALDMLEAQVNSRRESLDDFQNELKQRREQMAIGAARANSYTPGSGSASFIPSSGVEYDFANGLPIIPAAGAIPAPGSFPFDPSLVGGTGAADSHIPSIWPTTGVVTSPYGLRWDGTDFHPGMDIANDMGTPIVATADGVVDYAGWNAGGYGNMVDIDHGNGIMTRYGHASQVVVSAGQHVKRGQLIAYMGSTGFSTGPHVHYEVHVNGNRVNPISYL